MIRFYDGLTTTVALIALFLLVVSVYLIFKAKMRPAVSVLWFFVVLCVPLVTLRAKTSLPS